MLYSDTSRSVINCKIAPRTKVYLLPFWMVILLLSPFSFGTEENCPPYESPIYGVITKVGNIIQRFGAKHLRGTLPPLKNELSCDLSDRKLPKLIIVEEFHDHPTSRKLKQRLLNKGRQGDVPVFSEVDDDSPFNPLLPWESEGKLHGIESPLLHPLFLIRRQAYSASSDPNTAVTRLAYYHQQFPLMHVAMKNVIDKNALNNPKSYLKYLEIQKVVDASNKPSATPKSIYRYIHRHLFTKDKTEKALIVSEFMKEIETEMFEIYNSRYPGYAGKSELTPNDVPTGNSFHSRSIFIKARDRDFADSIAKNICSYQNEKAIFILLGTGHASGVMQQLVEAGFPAHHMESHVSYKRGGYTRLMRLLDFYTE